MSFSTDAFIKFHQIRMLLLGFGTTMMPAHHSVGSLILVITPMLSILSNSFLTLGLSESATRLGVVRVLFGLSLMVYSPSSEPKPMNNSGYLALQLSLSTESTLVTELSDSIAAFPARLYSGLKQCKLSVWSF